MHDYQLTAQLRALLVRLWIDLGHLQIGVTSGVAYVRGSLRAQPSPEELRQWKAEQESRGGDTENGPGLQQAVAARAALKLERSIRQMRGIRSMVLKFDNLAKSRGRWIPK